MRNNWRKRERQAVVVRPLSYSLDFRGRAAKVLEESIPARNATPERGASDEDRATRPGLRRVTLPLVIKPHSKIVSSRSRQRSAAAERAVRPVRRTAREADCERIRASGAEARRITPDASRHIYVPVSTLILGDAGWRWAGRRHTPTHQGGDLVFSLSLWINRDRDSAMEQALNQRTLPLAESSWHARASIHIHIQYMRWTALNKEDPKGNVLVWLIFNNNVILPHARLVHSVCVVSRYPYSTYALVIRSPTKDGKVATQVRQRAAENARPDAEQPSVRSRASPIIGPPQFVNVTVKPPNSDLREVLKIRVW